jgi:two-component sensor histidine kinase
LGLLLNELVSNSLKHAFPESGGHIHVSLRRGEQGGTDMDVSDDGIGLPKGFDPGQSRSMGLKLAVSLAGQLGGELAFMPGHAGGTTVRVHLDRL